MNKISKYKDDTQEFLKEIETEIKRITWPGRSDAIKSTIAVLTISAIFAVFLACADYIFSLVIGSFLS